jgi:ParB/RepB/Spo0J family partition protein
MAQGEEIIFVNITQIIPNNYNPNAMSKETFDSLLEDAKLHGADAFDPILIRPLDFAEGKQRFEIIDGENRWRVAQQLKWNRIRARIVNLSLNEAKVVNYRKNRERGTLDPFKEAQLFKSELEAGLTQEKIATKYGISQQQVNARLSLLYITDEAKNITTRVVMEKFAVTPSHLEAIAMVRGAEEQKSLAEKVVSEGLSVRQTELEAKRLNQRAEQKEEIFEVPEMEVIQTNIKRGDIFHLGRHRLMCGDASAKSDVEMLMNGQKATMIFTDPPYNEGYDYRNSNFTDKLDSYWDSLATTFSLMSQYLTENASIYVKHSSRQNPYMINFLERFFIIRNVIIWISNSQAHPEKNYDSYYEPIYFCTRGLNYTFNKRAELREKPPDYWSGEGKEFIGLLVNVWYDIKKDQAGCLTPEIPTINHKKIHPCSMPIRLPERAIKVSSNEGDIIIDFFGGSGSTLIACEKNKRVCYMMEIEPRYCQIIIDRWESYTSQKAIKVN